MNQLLSVDIFLFRSKPGSWGGGCLQLQEIDSLPCAANGGELEGSLIHRC